MSFDNNDVRWQSYGRRLAVNIRHLRTLRGLSQEELADLSHLARNQISNLERNNNNGRGPANPKLSTIYQVAHGLGVMPFLLLPAGACPVGKLCPDIGPEHPLEIHWPGMPMSAQKEFAAWMDTYWMESYAPSAPAPSALPMFDSTEDGQDEHSDSATEVEKKR